MINHLGTSDRIRHSTHHLNWL